MIDVTMKKPEAAKPFLKYVSSLPYELSIPEQAVQWVDINFNKDKASIVIGDVKFTVYAPSIAVRMLRMEKNK